MAIIKEEKKVCFMFSYCADTLKVNLNINWQMDILSKTIYVVDKIAFIAALY